MTPANLPASICARLRNLAERERVDFGAILTRYALERGMGFSVISAWVESMNGRWSLEPAEIGAKLTAVIPAV